jgi:CRISPR-associated protein Cas2
VIYLICYDIADDRRREAVSTMLSQFGARVQLSVFECSIEVVTDFDNLKRRLTDTIESDADQVRIYPLSDRSVRFMTLLVDTALRKGRTFGFSSLVADRQLDKHNRRGSR